jgi:hypothetical protein
MGDVDHRIDRNWMKNIPSEFFMTPCFATSLEAYLAVGDLKIIEAAL